VGSEITYAQHVLQVIRIGKYFGFSEANSATLQSILGAITANEDTQYYIY